MSSRPADAASVALREARAVIEGLMEVAELAMPDSYFETDSRTTAAREWLAANPDEGGDDGD